MAAAAHDENEGAETGVHKITLLVVVAMPPAAGCVVVDGATSGAAAAAPGAAAATSNEVAAMATMSTRETDNDIGNWCRGRACPR